MDGVACGQGHECSPARSKLMTSVIQRLVDRAGRGYRFGVEAVPQVFFADDGAFLAEDVAGLQMAFDAVWVAARITGLQIKVKPDGSKTAWMGVYWDGEGKAKEVSREGVYWDKKRREERVVEGMVGESIMRLPDGRRIPQVSQYKHLGTPMQAMSEGRLQPAREKIKSKCKGLISQISKVEALGPRQVERAIDLAIMGVCGYYCRATPMAWRDCEEIEMAKRRALRAAGLGPAEPAGAWYLEKQAGGMGHTHVYQIAAGAYVDQVDRALRGECGRPVRAAMADRIAAMGKRRGCRESPLTWHPEEQVEDLSEDDLAEAWLKYKIRAGRRGVLTGAQVPASLRAEVWGQAEVGGGRRAWAREWGGGTTNGKWKGGNTWYSPRQSADKGSVAGAAREAHTGMPRRVGIPGCVGTDEGRRDTDGARQRMGAGGGDAGGRGCAEGHEGGERDGQGPSEGPEGAPDDAAWKRARGDAGRHAGGDRRGQQQRSERRVGG